MKRASWWVTAVAGLTACCEPAATTTGSADAPAHQREGDAPSSEPAKVAETMPAIESVIDLTGTPVDPLATAGASATVLLFVSTHCPISNRYAPTMSRLATRWASEGATLWLVYPDPHDDPTAISAHQAEFSLHVPTVRDPEHALVARAGVRVTPEAAVFGPGAAGPVYTGRIDDRVVEFGSVRPHASAHELRDAVGAVLDGREPVAAGGPAIGCYISDLR